MRNLTVSNKDTVREAFTELLNSFEDDGIESALFTTFNYSSSFFENNVLPLIAAYPDNDIENMIDEQINRSLSRVKVAVICDRTTNPEPKGNYRYGLLSCGLKNAYFHPKLILIKGKLKDDTYGCKLMVSSANLTISGWGLNREVVGSCLVGTQQVKELNKLISWISTQAAKEIPVQDNKETPNTDEGGLIEHLETLQEFFKNTDLEQFPDEPELYIRLPSKTNNHSFFSRMLNNCTKPLHKLTVISPFWSEAKDLSPMIKKLGCNSITLIPSIDLQGNRKLPKSIREEFKKEYEHLYYADFKENDRYTHAKAIELNSDQENYIATGSANFTQAAMGSETHGNIEAMLVYRINKAGHIRKQVSKIDENSINWADVNEADDNPPAIPPFLATASYNWKTQKFTCNIECTSSDIDGIVYLSFFDKYTNKFKKIDDDQYLCNLQIPLVKPLYHFEIKYNVGANETAIFRGLVTQWNAKDDELLYYPQPKLSKLIDQLRALDPNKEPGRGGGFSTNSGAGNEGENEGSDEIFDFFFIFQAFYKLRGYFTDHPESDPFQPYTANSLTVLFRAIQLEKPYNEAQHIRYYILLSELKKTTDDLKKQHPSPESISLCEDIDREIKQYEEPFLNLLKASPVLAQLIGKNDSRAAAIATLKWFKEEL